MPATENALEARIAQLEQGQSRLRRITIALFAALVAAAGLGMAADQKPDQTIVAKSLQLVDNQGRLRVLINARAGVSLLDEKSRPRAVLSIDGSGPGLALYGKSSQVGAILNVNSDGPALAMRDNGGHTRAMLTAIDHGPALILSDEHDRERITLIQSGGGASVGILDSSGSYTWRQN